MCGREGLIRDSELEASRTELVIKVQGAEEELKKKVASLEEALTKANKDLGKSEVCCQEYKKTKKINLTLHKILQK